MVACCVPGCLLQKRKGRTPYCDAHRKQVWRHGRVVKEQITMRLPEKPPHCTAPNCQKPLAGSKFCAMHKARMATYGQLELPPRGPRLKKTNCRTAHPLYLLWSGLRQHKRESVCERWIQSFW